MRLILASMLVLAACAPGHRDLSRDMVRTDRCKAARAQRFAGRPFEPRIADRARIASRAILVRAIRPGEMVTMDYQEGRLNIELDGAGKIIRFRCG